MVHRVYVEIRGLTKNHSSRIDSMEIISVKVKNWHKYNRVDKKVKNHTWFALSNRFLENSAIFSLKSDEIRAVLYIFSQASLQKSEIVRVSFKHAKNFGRVSKRNLLSVLSKLPDTFEIVVSVSRNLLDDFQKNSRPHNSNSTLQDITVTGNDGNSPENQETNPYQEPQAILVTETLKKAFDGLLPPGVERAIPEIVEKFKTAENFRAWFLDVWNSEKAHKDKNPRWRSWVTGAIRNELLGNEKCLKSLSAV